MPSLARDQSLFVRERWPDMLYLVFRSRPKMKDLILTQSLPLPGSDFGAVIDAVGLGALIASHDPDGDNARFWERNIRRWMAREQAIEPQQIRRVCRAIKVNWIIALGLSGYPLHAVCLLFGLQKVGARSIGALCARAIFRHTSPSTVFESLQSQKACEVANRLQELCNLPTQKRLDDALEAVWGSNVIPVIPSIPRDLPASEPLHAAYMLLDGAIRGRGHNLAIRLASVQDYVSHPVLDWAKEIDPKPARLVPKNHINNKKAGPT
jgi:hypothetical protein